MGIPFIPSLHPRDLFGRFRKKKGGPQKASLKNRLNPLKRAEKIATKIAERQTKPYKVAATKYLNGSVRTRRR